MSFLSLFPQLMLSMLGFKSTETGRVSEEELRLIVTGAKMSGGIESQEGMMIEGVLDLQVICFLCHISVFEPLFSSAFWAGFHCFGDDRGLRDVSLDVCVPCFADARESLCICRSFDLFSPFGIL